MNISDKILAISAELGPKKKDLDGQRKRLEDLTAQIAEIDDNDQEELLLTEVEEVGKGVDTLAGEVEGLEKKLDSYRAIEKRQAVGSRPAQQDAPAMIRPEAKQSKPGDLIVRSAVVAALSHLRRCPEQQLVEELYPDDLRFKSAMPMLMKTAAPIATTTDANYAAALVQEDIRGIMETIESQSVAAAMALWASRSGGMLVNFGQASSIRVPVLSPTGATPTEPAWVQEGGAIPVGSLSIGSTIINRYKLAEILVTTMELKDRSTVDIEALFRRAIERAYARVLDNAFLSATASTAGVRPAGILNGITVVAGDTTGGVASVTADLQAMTAELLAINESAVPVLAINNRNRMGLGFTTSALGEFLFRDELNSGRVLGVPIVSSGNVPHDTAVMVDVSSLAMALGTPEFDVSQVATIVMNNADDQPPTMADDGTAGGAVGTAGQVHAGQGVVPANTAGAGYAARSLWQTYSEGVRMIAPTSWQVMRAGSVAGRNTLSW